VTWRNFIRADRDGNDVIVKLDTMLRVTRCEYHLRINVGSEIAAQLLADHLNQTRHSITSELVAKAYEDGYRDGRAKRGKRGWHDGRLGRDV